MRLETETPQQHAPRSGLILLQALVLGLFCLFTLRLWYLQVHKGGTFADMARDNQLRQVLISSARGRILDKGGTPLAVSEPSFALGLVREDCEDIEGTLAKVSEWTGVDKHVLSETVKRGKKRVKPFEPLILITDLPYEALARIEANAMLYPGLEIVVRQKRYYPTGALLSHVLGYVAEANEEELEKNPQLSLGDSVGKQGLELTHEDELRGSKGRKQVEVDAFGRQHNEFILEPPRAGSDLKLSIDIGLQKECSRLLEGQAGAILVMEPDTGKILAMASSPSFDPNAFTTNSYNSQYQLSDLVNDPNSPLWNRAAQSSYPLGSVFKLITASAALESGLYKPTTTYECTSQWTELGTPYNDWTFDKGLPPSGTLTLVEGLMRSCNPYFYHIGLDLYRQKGDAYLADMARGFGLGSATGIEAVSEDPGRINNPTDDGSASQMGIGQGDMLVTPLQVVDFIAAIANGGTLYRPQIIEKVTNKITNTQKTNNNVRSVGGVNVPLVQSGLLTRPALTTTPIHRPTSEPK